MRPFLLSTICLALLAGCDGAGTASAARAAEAPFLELTIDGIPVSIPLEDVSSSYYPDGTLRFFAGAYRQTSVMLIVPDIANCPCQVPAGSVEPGATLSQGAVSLQHYPNPANGLSSWYSTQSGTPDDNAIEITDIGTPKDRVRMIAGRIHATVLKTETNGTGPENHDYRIEGSFRLPHRITGTEGF